MTIDKIKYYMDPIIFAHWSEVQDITVLKRAEKELSGYIENGMMTGIKYQAELKLLRMKIGQP